MLVVVSYTIISNYTQTDLYNLDTGAVITNPTSYYQQLANRSYGANKIYYMDLYGEVLQQYMAALRSGVCRSGPSCLWPEGARHEREQSQRTRLRRLCPGRGRAGGGGGLL